jgi:hypothetical protein
MGYCLILPPDESVNSEPATRLGQYIQAWTEILGDERKCSDDGFIRLGEKYIVSSRTVEQSGYGNCLKEMFH